MAFAWRRPHPATRVRVAQADPRVDSRACRLILRLFLLGLYGWMALALWFGQDRVTNSTRFVFVWLWVGVVPLAPARAGVQRANPLRAPLLSWPRSAVARSAF